VGDWFPPLIEALIASSILYMAVENVLSVWLGSDSPASLRWRWLVAGAFGLVHGFGFSFVLQQDLQLAGSHLLLSLLAFNVGVELGQLAVLLLVVPILAVLLQRPKVRPAGIIILSALIGHVAWHWMVERLEALRFVRWPPLEEALGWLLAGAALLAVVGGAVWLSRKRRPERVPAAAFSSVLIGMPRRGGRHPGGPRFNRRVSWDQSRPTGPDRRAELSECERLPAGRQGRRAL
jgi:hypothetical protein